MKGKFDRKEEEKTVYFFYYFFFLHGKKKVKSFREKKNPCVFFPNTSFLPLSDKKKW